MSDPEIFEKLSFLPLPVLNSSKEHYVPSVDLYCKPPDEKDRPSLQPTGDVDAIEADARHKALFNSSKVRSIVPCQECFKPRCVYSVRKLVWNELVLLKSVIEEKIYTCGSAIFTPASQLMDTVVVRQNIGCINPVETQYYSATLVSFPPVCYYCGVEEECFVEDDTIEQLRSEYAVVRPLCFLCKNDGKIPFVKMPRNSRKRPRQD